MREINKVITRRNFTKMSATAIGSIPMLGFSSPFIIGATKPKDQLNINLFSKHLQFLNYKDMAEVSADLGFDGLDITVRPKGHVLPERVVDDLPEAVDAMMGFGMKPGMITTEVWDLEVAANKAVLETASALAFTHYRTGWLTYPENRSILESQAIYGHQAKKLELFNKALGLIGCYQNHAGNHVGAPIWDLRPILEATQNEHFGAQYDIRHAVVEGGTSWELGLRQIKPYIKSLVIKDFKWGQFQGKWKLINTPLGEGMVDFNRYFSLLKKYDINVPISLHLEYPLGGAEHGNRTLSVDKKVVFAQMKKDLTFLRNTWQQAEKAR